MKLKLSEQKHNNRIGIDLSTKKVGVGVFIDGEEKQFMGFSYTLKNTPHWDNTLIEEMKAIIGNRPEIYSNFEVYIEVGNFGSPLVTQKFAFLAGIIWGLLKEQGCEVVHIVRPSDWFDSFIKRNKARQINRFMDRKNKKDLSIAELNNDIKSNKVSLVEETNLNDEDIADAYMIARYGNTCMHAFWDKPKKEEYKKCLKRL